MTSAPERLDLPGAEVLLWRSWLAPAEAGALFPALLAQIAWRRSSIRMFGREIPEPRLTAWYGDAGAHYRYSGRDNSPEPWIPALARLRHAVQTTCGEGFDSVLANQYRDGADHMGWHADDEPELGQEPVIASVSLGEVRRMQFRPRPRGPIALTLDLGPGSLLVMSGGTQALYHHRIPATRAALGPRINLTFRRVSGVGASLAP